MFKSCEIWRENRNSSAQRESAEAIAYSMGHHSGGHLNPAVTLSLLGINSQHYPTSVVRFCKIGLIFISVATHLGMLKLNCGRFDFCWGDFFWTNDVTMYMDRCGSWHFLYFDVFVCLCVCVWSQNCVELLHIYIWIYSKALQWCRSPDFQTWMLWQCLDNLIIKSTWWSCSIPINEKTIRWCGCSLSL